MFPALFNLLSNVRREKNSKSITHTHTKERFIPKMEEWSPSCPQLPQPPARHPAPCPATVMSGIWGTWHCVSCLQPHPTNHPTVLRGRSPPCPARISSVLRCYSCITSVSLLTMQGMCRVSYTECPGCVCTTPQSYFCCRPRKPLNTRSAPAHPRSPKQQTWGRHHNPAEEVKPKARFVFLRTRETCIFYL